MKNDLINEDVDLSVVLIIKDESNRLSDCLSSVQDLKCEIVVVDSGSSDDSIKIAKEFTKKIYSHPEWRGFGVQRQIAQSYATKSWILMIDADERLTPSLVTEIKECINSDVYDGYRIKRSNYFLNRELRYGGGVDTVLRLYKKNKGECNDSEVHEKIILDGRVGKLKHSMLHFSTGNLYDAISKMNQYSELGCIKLINKQADVFLLSAIMHGFWTFFRIYVFQFGFLDGKPGFILAVLKAEGSYYKYVKLLMKEKGDGP